MEDAYHLIAMHVAHHLQPMWIRLSRTNATDRAREQTMNLLLILIILLVLLGGGGFYAGGPRLGGSAVGLILLIIVILALMGRL